VTPSTSTSTSTTSTSTSTSTSSSARSAGPAPHVTEPVGPPRPSALRRAAVVVVTAVASVPPVVWGVGTVVQMATGTEADHLFHQVVGQGLLLSALWLAALWPLAAAGWRGRRASVAATLHAAAFTAAAVAAAAMAPGNGGAFVSGFVVVTVALLWWALPARPRLRGLARVLDPVGAPVVALLAGLHVTFAVTESALQRAMGDEHATMSHNYDMAWVSLALVLLGAAAVLFPEARRLLLWTGLGSVVVGASRFLITGEVWWSLAVTALGALATALVLVRRREQPTR
jgi:hypothetical protein